MRARIPLVILGPDGRPAAGSVSVTRRADATTPPVYAAETGPTTIGQPLTASVYGRVPGWLDRGAYSATITVAGMEAQTEAFEIGPAADGAVDASWLAEVTLADLPPAIKPSGTAAPGDEALRALGTTAGTAAAGDDPRLAVPEAWRYVGAVGQPAFLAGWTNYALLPGFAPVRFRRDRGITYLAGTAQGPGTGTGIFVLPAGYRPSGVIIPVTWCGVGGTQSAGRMQIQADGAVFLHTGAGGEFVSLDGITFPADV